jgi:hypothetical protein
MDDPNTPEGTEYQKRADFLIAMYNQLMGDINRHIVVVWQMAGVLGASIAAVAIAESKGFPLAIGILLLMLVCFWALEHIHDSNFWYNRNLVMITNIERVFLTEDDIDLVHPYFASHRKSGSFLTHLEIHRNYIKITALGSLAYFLNDEIIPYFSAYNDISLLKIMPFAVFAVLIARDIHLTEKYEKKYQDYLAISPGIQISRKPNFGGTHGKP